jgi:hypothetical protein
VYDYDFISASSTGGIDGSLLQGLILKALSQEKKIPDLVSMALQKLNDAIDTEEADSIDEELLELVKGCGMSCDITKHNLSAFG